MDFLAKVDDEELQCSFLQTRRRRSARHSLLPTISSYASPNVSIICHSPRPSTVKLSRRASLQINLIRTDLSKEFSDKVIMSSAICDSPTQCGDKSSMQTSGIAEGSKTSDSKPLNIDNSPQPAAKRLRSDPITPEEKESRIQPLPQSPHNPVSPPSFQAPPTNMMPSDGQICALQIMPTDLDDDLDERLFCRYNDEIAAWQALINEHEQRVNSLYEKLVASAAQSPLAALIDRLSELFSSDLRTSIDWVRKHSTFSRHTDLIELFETAVAFSARSSATSTISLPSDSLSIPETLVDRRIQTSRAKLMRAARRFRSTIVLLHHRLQELHSCAADAAYSRRARLRGPVPNEPDESTLVHTSETYLSKIGTLGYEGQTDKIRPCLSYTSSVRSLLSEYLEQSDSD